MDENGGAQKASGDRSFELFPEAFTFSAARRQRSSFMNAVVSSPDRTYSNRPDRRGASPR